MLAYKKPNVGKQWREQNDPFFNTAYDCPVGQIWIFSYWLAGQQLKSILGHMIPL